MAGTSPESFRLCRSHDRQLKREVVRSRPKKAPESPDDARPNVVRCGQCGRELAEPSNASPEGRTACPDCGSTNRTIEVFVAETLQIHSSLSVRHERPGVSGFLAKLKGGDDYTRDLDAWGHRELVIDQEHDLYREVIELWDGTRIESRAALHDHPSR